MLLKVDYAPQIGGKAYSRRFVRPSDTLSDKYSKTTVGI